MELSFIGIGSAFSDDINNSAYIKYKNNMLLIDCGETVFNEIKRRGLVENVDNLFVFITHTHSDHIGSLSSLIHYMYYIKNKKVHLLYGENYKIKSDIEELLKINGNSKEQYEFVAQENLKQYFGFNDVTLFEVKHSPNMHSYAIKLGKVNSREECENIYYTGDCCDKEFLKVILKDKHLYKVYCDVSLYGGVHLAYEDAVKIFEAYKNKVCFMHLENGFIKNRLKIEGFACAKQGVDYSYEK